ncbi:hypothetical protein KUCAC02_021146 [Chaenocephalus aceratus]|uniref:Uncharacterized protein n=1 Tax=Chaenocephalus aceratus TaxID=36190 RepID=A0ACB9XEL6_CHAAC|nr:hypothetical protein KUCAC02_021146 [Chaenocephalus aceratus]
MDVACSPGVDGQEVWQCQTEVNVGGRGCCVLRLCPSSPMQLTLVQQVQFPKALRRK